MGLFHPPIFCTPGLALGTLPSDVKADQPSMTLRPGAPRQLGTEPMVLLAASMAAGNTQLPGQS